MSVKILISLGCSLLTLFFGCGIVLSVQLLMGLCPLTDIVEPRFDHAVCLLQTMLRRTAFC